MGKWIPKFPDPIDDETAAAISREALRVFPDAEPATATAEEIIKAGRELCRATAGPLAAFMLEDTNVPPVKPKPKVPVVEPKPKIHFPIRELDLE